MTLVVYWHYPVDHLGAHSMFLDLLPDNLQDDLIATPIADRLLLRRKWPCSRFSLTIVSV